MKNLGLDLGREIAKLLFGDYNLLPLQQKAPDGARVEDVESNGFGIRQMH